MTAHIITHAGREYDLTALETPFGLLPEPVQEALKAWPHGVNQFTSCGWRNHAMHKVSYHPCVTYRAKPAPAEVRVNCWRQAFARSCETGTCIKRADGSIDWATWEPSYDPT